MPSLSVRAAAVNDAAAINRIYNHYVRNTAITFDIEPWNTQRRTAWIGEFADSESPYHAVVAELDGEVAGFPARPPSTPTLKIGRVGRVPSCIKICFNASKTPNSTAHMR